MRLLPFSWLSPQEDRTAGNSRSQQSAWCFGYSVGSPKIRIRRLSDSEAEISPNESRLDLRRRDLSVGSYRRGVWPQSSRVLGVLRGENVTGTVAVSRRSRLERVVFEKIDDALVAGVILGVLEDFRPFARPWKRNRQDLAHSRRRSVGHENQPVGEI